jgi:hypothetical protein
MQNKFIWNDRRHEVRIASFQRRGTKRGVVASSKWLEGLSHWPGSMQYEPCPPETRKRFYKYIADWALMMGAKSIGGPVMSGAILASGIAAVSGRLDSFLIDKPERQPPRRHPPNIIRGMRTEPFILVDDVLCTAQEMERAVTLAGDETEGLKAVLVMDNRFRLESKPSDVPITCRLLKKGLIYGISYKADPPYEEW